MVPFSERVTEPRWRREAEEWIHAALTRVGMVVSGPVSQPRVRPWSTQLVAPLEGGGQVWFKACCPAQAFEPKVQQLLAHLLPHHVDVPLAADARRAWMLTRDRGTTLQASRPPTLSDWQAVLRGNAELQRALRAHAGAMLASGVPDCSPGTVVQRLTDMTATLAGLPAGHPAHLAAEVAEQLYAATGRVAAAADLLAASALGTSLQHGDLHPGNVFAVDGELHVFDFGDAQVAHPLECLAVPWALTHRDPELPWGDLLAAYHEPWADLTSLEDLAELLPAALTTQPVNRSLTWWACLAEASEQEWAEWGEAPVRHLTNVLLPWP
jgi:Phosphotransferase enzyme family